MTIEIKREDITVERKQYNPDPGLGLCDVCRRGKATWEVVLGWKRRFPFQVPLVSAYAFICAECHKNEPGAIEYIRAYFERQANYLADRAATLLTQLGVTHDETGHSISRSSESSTTGGSDPALREQPPAPEVPEASGRQ